MSAYEEHLDQVFAPVQAEADRLRAELGRQALSPDPAHFAYHVRCTAFNVLAGKMAGDEWRVPLSGRDAIARAVVDAVEPLIRADERAIAARQSQPALLADRNELREALRRIALGTAGDPSVAADTALTASRDRRDEWEPAMLARQPQPAPGDASGLLEPLHALAAKWDATAARNQRNGQSLVDQGDEYGNEGLAVAEALGACVVDLRAVLADAPEPQPAPELAAQPPSPEPDGTIVIGPQCFASADKRVISWHGINYYPWASDPDHQVLPAPELATLRELLDEIGVMAANAPEDDAFAVCQDIAMRIAAADIPDDGRHPDECPCQFCREDEREERDREELDDDTDNTIPDTERGDL